MPKHRLDLLVVERGLAATRARAQALIKAGCISCEGEVVTKPGAMLEVTAAILLTGEEHPWVSRGGMKLAHALEVFAVNPSGMVCVDIGASTGGFTDVLLQAGALKVFAVDVGHGQLHEKLMGDPRVVVMEKTNARYLAAEQIPDALDLIVCDASFISLKTLLPAVLGLAQESGIGNRESGGELSAPPIAERSITGAVGHVAGATGKSAEQGQLKKLIALIKPQFEVGRERVGKGGVVRDPEIHREVCADIRRWLEEDMGWRVEGLMESPVQGPMGNREFLIFARKCGIVIP